MTGRTSRRSFMGMAAGTAALVSVAGCMENSKTVISDWSQEGEEIVADLTITGGNPLFGIDVDIEFDIGVGESYPSDYVAYGPEGINTTDSVGDDADIGLQPETGMHRVDLRRSNEVITRLEIEVSEE